MGTTAQRYRRSALAPALALWFTAGCVPGTTFTVDTTIDAVDMIPGDGICNSIFGACTLRAAIQEANAMPGGNNILVPPGTYVLTIPEPGNGDIKGGDLDVTDTLRIRPAGASMPVIEAGGEFRVFELNAGFVRLDSLVIRNGDAQGQQEGGGLEIHPGTLVWGFFLDIRDNRAFSRGAGIMTYGSLVLFDSQIRDNYVDARGGGIRASSTATTTLWYSTVSGNTANIGGGVHNQGTLSVFNSTLSGNTAAFGGGGIFNSGIATLANATVAFNESNDSANARTGGVWVFGEGAMTIRNTIIANNQNTYPGTPDDCSGTFLSQGYNLILDASGCTIVGTLTGNITGQDPLLKPLQVNGAGTPTHALSLSPGSPALGAGNPPPRRGGRRRSVGPTTNGIRREANAQSVPTSLPGASQSQSVAQEIDDRGLRE